MNTKALFVETIRADKALPPILREHADAVKDVEEHRFDQSYIAFLDEQIQLSPRGPDWTARLKRRRDALAAFADVTLLRGSLQVGGSRYTLEINPKQKAVIHWEEYNG